MRDIIDGRRKAEAELIAQRKLIDLQDRIQRGPA